LAALDGVPSAPARRDPDVYAGGRVARRRNFVLPFRQGVSLAASHGGVAVGNRRVALQQLAGVGRADAGCRFPGSSPTPTTMGPQGGPLRDAVLRDVHATA
jgi:hypothetical protein